MKVGLNASEIRFHSVFVIPLLWIVDHYVTSFIDYSVNRQLQKCNEDLQLYEYNMVEGGRYWK